MERTGLYLGGVVGGSGGERSGAVGRGRERSGGVGPRGKTMFRQNANRSVRHNVRHNVDNKYDDLKTPKLREGCHKIMSNNYVETLCRIIFHFMSDIMSKEIMSKDYVERLCRTIMSKDYVERLCRKIMSIFRRNIMSKYYVENVVERFRRTFCRKIMLGSRASAQPIPPPQPPRAFGVTSIATV